VQETWGCLPRLNDLERGSSAGSGDRGESNGSTVQTIGDDLFAANPDRVAGGGEDIVNNASNAVLTKLNQIRMLSETLDAIGMMASYDWKAIVSHRSGETSNTFISDLVVGLNIGQGKTGLLSRSECIEKYNRLLEIEDDLGGAARFAGTTVFAGKSNVSR
jgi:enolase